MLQLNWNTLRTIFGGSLTQGQVTNINFMLTEVNAAKITNPYHFAYMLATVKHETAKTMAPIKEIGSPEYFFKMYDMKGTRPKVAASLGNTYAGDGAKFFGRGYVQITGRSNYSKFGKLIGVDFIKNPDLALDPENAVKIMIQGMTKGLFTGVSLSTFTDAKGNLDMYNARKIINGLDRATIIADYAKQFLTAILVQK